MINVSLKDLVKILILMASCNTEEKGTKRQVMRGITHTHLQQQLN